MTTDGKHLFSANSFTLGLKNRVLVPDARFITWTGFANDGDWKLASQLDPKEESYALMKIESTYWTRACIQSEFSQSRTAASYTNPRKWIASFS